MIFNQDCELRYRWVENAASCFDPVQFVGRTDAEILPHPASEIATRYKYQALSTGESLNFELPVFVGGKMRLFDVRVHPDLNSDGSKAGITGSSIDITDERENAQSMANLILEVSHRSRNLLSIVQSIASQAARSETSVESYSSHFIGRLQSLSKTQDIITARDWQGASLRNLIDAQVEPLGKGAGSIVNVQGGDVFLTPVTAVHLGLAIHELASNAAEFCIFRGGRKSVAVKIAIEQADCQTTKIRWEEQLVRAPTGREFDAFGLLLLEKAAPAVVGGEAQMVLRENGLVYELTMPNIPAHAHANAELLAGLNQSSPVGPFPID